MNPQIMMLPETPICGLSRMMSLENDQTYMLWRQFAPGIKNIPNRANQDRISMKIFPAIPGSDAMNPATLFEKWAAVPVNDFSRVPEGLQTFTIPAGLYAVVLHKGPDEIFTQTLEYLFTKWLPDSSFEVDNRPHFEILGENYRVNDPESEETIWVPVKAK